MHGKTLFEIFTDYDNLYNAHLSCRKGKRWKDSVAIYDMRGLEYTLALQESLLNGTYHLSPYNCFVISERGKRRNIKSIKYKDRVVQKSLMDNILTPTVVPTFINTNCASLKYRGTDFALERLRKDMQSYYYKYGTEGYFLICDMKGYFDSIPHDLLNDFYEKKIDDERIMNLIREIHASIPGGRGVPLGNQLSQLDALVALSPLDHKIKEKLHIKYYVRYMDDFYLIHQDKEYLKQCLKEIQDWVEQHGMKLNTKKTKIVPLKQGIDFLGFHFYMTNTGKVVQKLLKKSIKHHKRKLKKMKKLLDKGECTFQACKDAHNGWKAHAKRGDTYYLIRKMDNFFNELFADNIKEEKDGKGIK